MALSWDITKCDRIPRDPLDSDSEDEIGPVTEEFWPVVERTIFRMMAVGHGWSLTDENKQAFYLRSRFYCNLTGDTQLSPEEVHRMVGLSVNVSPETETRFRKRVLDAKYHEWKGTFARETRDL